MFENLTPEWVRTNLLDKNGNPSRLKKKKHLTQEHVCALRKMTGYDGDDINSLIFAYLYSTKDYTCQHQSCTNPVQIDKHGQARMFCSLSCSNDSNHMKEAVSKGITRAYEQNGKTIQEKRERTNLERHGVSHILQNPDVAKAVAIKSLSKKKETIRRRQEEHRIKHGMLLQQKAANWSEETVKRLEDIDYLTDCFIRRSLSIEEISLEVGCSPSTISHRISELGLTRDKNHSVGERQIHEFLMMTLPFDQKDEKTVIRHERKLFGNRFELDFYLPRYNLAIEYHGIYWHSLSQNDATKIALHQNKHLACAEKGIRLIQIFEDEWQDKRKICESMITSALGKTPTRINGRDCTITELTTKEAKAFLTENHMNGYVRSQHRLGLLNPSGELVSAMTFVKSRFDRTVEWEIGRFATKLNCMVHGGASRLFQHFIKNYSPISIGTYADLRFGNGGVYQRLGFVKAGMTKPGYHWLINKRRVHRSATTKKRLPTLMGASFDPNLSEADNLFGAGARRIYDAGHNRYVYEVK